MNFFKNMFSKKEDIKEKKSRLLNQGANAIFSFLDEVLTKYKNEDFQTVTPQIFLTLYMVGMSKRWCELSKLCEFSGMKTKSQYIISSIVIDGIYDRYNIDLREWGYFINDMFPTEGNPQYHNYKFINEKIQQGADHFFYFCALKFIPHNPLDLLLKKWCKIEFYNDNYPYAKGKIEGVFSENEYSFISQKMMYDMPEVPEDRTSLYQQILPSLNKYPFIPNEYYLDK